MLRFLQRLTRRAFAYSNSAVKHNVQRISRRAYASSNSAVKHDVQRISRRRRFAH